MALSLGNLCDELATVFSTGRRANDDMRTSFRRWVNMACRAVAYSYPWDSMRDLQTVSTVGTYTTGTVTATLGSTTVTGSGTTWTAAMTGRKFALTQGGPRYRFTYVSATSGTLEDAFAEATVSGSAYVIFQDEYDLAATTHSVEDVNAIGSNHRGPVWPAGMRSLDHSDYMAASTGPPQVWSQAASTTVGTPRVRFQPCPDGVYRVEFRYLKSWTPMAAETDLYTTQGLPEDVEELILDRALRWGPRIEGSRRVMSDRDWRAALKDAWIAYRRTRGTVGHRTGIGARAGGYRVVFNMSGIVTA